MKNFLPIQDRIDTNSTTFLTKFQRKNVEPACWLAGKTNNRNNNKF